MAQQMQTPKARQATPERWQKAAARAIAEGVQVRQVNANGMWVATSGTDVTMAYLIEVTNGVAHSCTCPAGEFGDPVCKHRAAFYLLIGALVVPEPEPPAPAPILPCLECNGCGVHSARETERAGLLCPTCRSCNGTGTRTPAQRPAA